MSDSPGWNKLLGVLSSAADVAGFVTIVAISLGASAWFQQKLAFIAAGVVVAVAMVLFVAGHEVY